MKTLHELPQGGTYIAGRSHLTDSQLALAESLCYRYGEAYDSYLLLEADRHYFFSSDRQGVIGFARWGRHLYVVGGLLTSPDRKETLLQEFLDFASCNRLSPKFFNLLKTDQQLFRRFGFRVSKIGEEPLVDLRVTEWRGKPYEWVRRQENYCRRSGLFYREVDLESLEADERDRLVQGLKEVSDEHVQATVHGRELGLTVARVDFDRMYRRRLFIAEDREGPVAFVMANPAYGGGLWAVETYRKSSRAPRGVITFLIMKIARQLKAEGVPFLSLCQVPSLRAAGSAHSESLLVDMAMRLWWKTVPWFYDLPRQFHFKSRFRPVYRECFVAIPPGFQLGSLFVFALKWGVILPDFRRVPALMKTRTRKWFHRERLADPAAEDRELIDDLAPLVGEHCRRQELLIAARQTDELDLAAAAFDDDRCQTSIARSDRHGRVSTTAKEAMTAGS